MSLADELQKLQQLRDSGALSEAEFQLAKDRMMQPSEPQPSGQTQPQPQIQPQIQPTSPPAPPRDVEQETRQWGLFLHLSQYAGFLVPLAGHILPIVLWQVKKNDLPGLDPHGKVVLNWTISAFLYALICVPLCFILIGIPLLVALGIICLIYPILGALKANEGKVWAYPGSIRFLT